MTETTGRCLCGAVRYAFDVDRVVEQDFCHCESCRRATGAPVAAFVMARRAAFRWTGAAPRTHASSPGVTRGFCGTCGTPMFYRTEARADQIDLYAATLDAPERAAPEFHAHWSERLPWLRVADDLPKED